MCRVRNREGVLRNATNRDRPVGGNQRSPGVDGTTRPAPLPSTRPPEPPDRRRRGTAILRPHADVAQLARASACHAEGRGFESLHPLLVKAPLRRGFCLPGKPLHKASYRVKAASLVRRSRRGPDRGASRLPDGDEVVCIENPTGIVFDAGNVVHANEPDPRDTAARPCPDEPHRPGGASADLLVTIVGRPDPVRVDYIVSFSIAVHNRGPQRVIGSCGKAFSTRIRLTRHPDNHPVPDLLIARPERGSSRRTLRPPGRRSGLSHTLGGTACPAAHHRVDPAPRSRPLAEADRECMRPRLATRPCR
jgi:hypothetical protein